MNSALVSVRKQPDGTFAIVLRTVERDAAAAAVEHEFSETVAGWSLAEPALDPQGDAIEIGRIGELFQGADDATLQAIGRFLHKLLGRGAVAAPWLEVSSPANNAPGWRILLDVAPRDLRALPWEVLRHPDKPRWLARTDRIALSRGKVRDDLVVDPCELPLRMLVIVGCLPDDAKVKWREEIAAIEEVLRPMGPDVDLEVMHGVNRAALDRSFKLFQPHILHFIGHGERSDKDKDAALVVWRGEEKRTFPWRPDDILEDLAGHRVHLAYINACHSGAVAPTDRWSASDPFLELDAPAVVAVTGAIEGALAATLAASFYRRVLRERLPVDVALSRARLDADQLFAGQRRETFLPMLTVQADPTRILALRGAGAADAGAPPAPTPVGDFVDRKAERRRLFAGALPTAPAKRPAPVLLVRGAGEVGKSELAKVFFDICARQGHLPVYCELTGKDPLDAETVLERIHDAVAPKGLAVDDARVTAFADFRTRRQQLRAAQLAPSPAAAAAAMTTSAARGNEDLVQGLFDAFATALREISQQRPVLVVLDHLRRNGGRVAVEPWTLNMLPRLKEWASTAALGRARLVIVASVEESLELGLDELVKGDGAKERLVEVPPFSKDDAESLLSEWLLRYVDQAMVAKLLPFLVLQATAEPVWKPTLIAQFRAMPAFAKGVRQ